MPHANIRSEANDRAPVVTQVPSGTLLQLLSVEGDWFHVRVPVGSIRIEAYISKKVAALASPPGAAATTPRCRNPDADARAQPASSTACRSRSI